MTARRQWLRLAFGGALFSALPAGRAAPRLPQALHWRERALQGFGTTLWLRAAHANVADVEAGLDAAVGAIRTVEHQMSLFDPNSALCQLNRDATLDHPQPDLLAVLRLARHISQRSQGAFDVTMQPVWAAWARAQREKRIPSDAELRSALDRVDWRAVAIEPARVRLRRSGMALTLNGIAQGWAADRAKAALQSFGVQHALLDTGEWSELGLSPEGAPWTLGIANPRAADAVLARVCARGRAVATSSDAHLVFSADRVHHHILDPRTGRSPLELASVTVVAPTGALADALTKVIFMGGWQRALALARQWNVGVFVVDKHGRWQASEGLALT